jgi:hypothetical protein
MTTPEDEAFEEAIIQEGIAQSSVAVCRVMARFCLRLSQVANCPDEMRSTLIATANRWHDAAISKLEAKRKEGP